MVGSVIRPVAVGVDGTLASIAGLDLAAEEAMARVVPLVVVSIMDGSVDPGLGQHRRLLDLAVSRAAAEHPGLSVSGELVRGEPVDALVAWSRKACLLVVGHTHSGSRSVAEQVARLAAAPVIVHRPFSTRSGTERPVLVGVGDRAHSRATVEFASVEAALRGVPLTEVPVGSPLVDLVAASHHAGLVVADVPLTHALVERAGCPVGIIG